MNNLSDSTSTLQTNSPLEPQAGVHSLARVSTASLNTKRFGFRFLARLLVTQFNKHLWLFILRVSLVKNRRVRKSLSEQLAVLEARRAYGTVPAYRDFIDNRCEFNQQNLTFEQLPETHKDSYIKPHLLNPRDLYVNRTIPNGSAWDTSTGTSGKPTFWYRGVTEVQAASRTLQHRARLMVGNVPYTFVNGFALGQWATGMTAARTVGQDPLCIAHNVGANPELMLQTIKESWKLDPTRLVVVAGYPPHIETLVCLAAQEGVALHAHPTVAIVGGEALSETQRQRITWDAPNPTLATGFQRVYSFYGASDLDVNLGVETPYTVMLRRTLMQHPTLAKQLLGDVGAFIPMVFAYDPLNYLIEVNESGQLLYTELSGDRISPRVRYNLGDKGTVRTLEEVEDVLDRAKIHIPLPTGCNAPMIFVWGRTDDSVTFRGANLAWENLHEALRHLNLAQAVVCYGIAQYESEGRVYTELLLHFNTLDVQAGAFANKSALLRTIVAELCRLNGDFAYQISKINDLSDYPSLRVYKNDSPMAEHARQNPARKQKHLFLGADVQSVFSSDDGGELIPWDRGSETNQSFEVVTNSFVARSAWRQILEIARHCPSPHNVQPWKFQILADGWAELYVDGTRTFPFTDYTGSFVISSMAMLLYYMECTAANHGYNVQIELENVEQLDFTNKRSLFARLKLSPNGATAHGAFSDEELMRRMTSRLPNIRQPLPAFLLTTVKNIASDFGHTLTIIDKQSMIKKVLTQDVKALMHDINDAEYFGELKPYLRLGKKTENPDGLHVDVMNLPVIQMAALKHLPKITTIPGVSQTISSVYASQLGHCEHLCLIGGDFWKRNDSLRAGRMLISIWLELSRHHAMVHPFGNLITNRKARSTVEQLTGTRDLWFVCRLGYTAEPNTSNRLTVEEIASFTSSR